MAFERIERSPASIPQRFADTYIPRCPMCKSADPQWAVGQRRETLLPEPEEAAHNYLFRCERCGCILRVCAAAVERAMQAPVQDAANKLPHRRKPPVYITIEDVGHAQKTYKYRDREMTLEELYALTRPDTL